MFRVLFVCVENAGRSQMAEAFAKRLGVFAISAGTVPATRIIPTVVEAMKEKEIELSANHPKMLTMQMVNEADLVITMGCSVEEVCPAPLIARIQKKLVDWSLEDPKNKPIEEVRQIRDEVKAKVEGLIKELVR